MSHGADLVCQVIMAGNHLRQTYIFDGQLNLTLLTMSLVGMATLAVNARQSVPDYVASSVVCLSKPLMGNELTLRILW